MELIHVRSMISGKSMLSTLHLKHPKVEASSPLFFLLEDLPAYDRDGDGDEDKVHGETAIEAGEGFLVPWFSGKFFDDYKSNHKEDFALALQMVPGVDRWGKNIVHGNIRLHTGLTPAHTLGCVIPGTKPYINSKTGQFNFQSGSSGDAYHKMFYPMVRKLWEPGMKDFKTPIKYKIIEVYGK